jgi:ABC-2 type transport system ATP-binding protein
MIAAAEQAIEIDRLRVFKGGGSVLEEVSLTVRQQEILGLAGRRGAGKTSLLQAVVNLIAPQSGAIRVFGEPHDVPGSRARLAYLPECFQPPGHLSGHEFVRLTLILHGDRAKRAQTALLAEEIGLDPAALNHPIRSYAKGMTQKLGLLVTLLSDLPLLVLDEPMSGLDPGARRLIKHQLADCRDRGRTILLSSSIATDHDELCDRVAILERGRLCAIGSPAELKIRYHAPTLTSALLLATRQSPAVAAT